jgi:predicted regulator of Ras-like GTPase activity (Roadblock/LC7/MglB family)
MVTRESSLIASPTMEDARRALEDLVEISPQIEAAALVAGDGTLRSSVGVPAAEADALGRAVQELLDGAASFRSDGSRVTQIHAALADGEVFAVTGKGGTTVVSLLRERTAPGLVFYDLKQCLAAVDRSDDAGS